MAETSIARSGIHMETPARPRSYKDLLVWRKGLDLVALIYRITGGFPPDERYGLVSQLRRAAVSVPSNIAEGQAHNTTGEFIQGIAHAEGSLAELETQLLISINLGSCGESEARPALALIDEIQRMLHALRAKLDSRR